MPVLTESDSPGVVPLPAYTPLSFLKRHTLPVATYLRNPTFTPGLDVKRPILLFSCYTSKKVQASSLKLQRDATFSRVGPPLVIPDTYSGWFSLITTDGLTAPCYSSVEEVICAKISFFLTRQDITGYIIKDEDSPGRISYKRTAIQAGNVLKILGVYEDLNRKPTGLLQRNSLDQFPRPTKYAQCLNFKNEIVYVPLTTSGKFYATAQKSSRSHTRVYLMSQLLKNFKFPLTVKLVCGYMPKAPCSFTGIIALEKTYQEDVILACTMTSKATASFFEMEVESNFLLSPVKDPVFSKSPIYLKTLSYCQDEAEAWQKQMKITHNVTEKRTRSLTRSLSDKFSDPLSSIRSSSFPINTDQENRPSRGKFGLAKAKLWESFLEKDPKKKADKKQRRLSKQNTYVFQLVKRHRILRKESDNYSGLGTRRSHSFDNLEYCQVQDKLETHKEDTESSEESIYAEIGEPPPKKEKCDGEYMCNVTPAVISNEISKDESKEGGSDITDPEFIQSKAYTECATLVLPKNSEKCIILPPLKETPPPTPKLTKDDEKDPESSDKYIEEGEEISVISIDASSSLSTPKISEETSEITEDKVPETSNHVSNGIIANKSRIVMRGNTVVIRVKDTSESHPCLTEKSVSSVFRSDSIKTDDLNGVSGSQDKAQDCFKIRIVTNEHYSDTKLIESFHPQPACAEA